MPHAMYIILHFVEFSGQIYGAEIIAAWMNYGEVVRMEILRITFS
jgi:hypothetical protein